MRTRTEMDLLNLRQRYRDYLKYLRSRTVIPLEEYRKAYIRYEACNRVLIEYRLNYKFKDIA